MPIPPGETTSLKGPLSPGLLELASERALVGDASVFLESARFLRRGSNHVDDSKADGGDPDRTEAFILL